jgi:hypothetical protein
MEKRPFATSSADSFFLTVMSGDVQARRLRNKALVLTLTLLLRLCDHCIYDLLHIADVEGLHASVKQLWLTVKRFTSK